MLEVGTKAPEFTLMNQNGESVSLSDFSGKKLILYFYSKDMTSGCSKQACGFAELYPQFEEKGAVVVGVSRDSVERHKRFEEKKSLNFTLLSDEDSSVHEAYDVLREKTVKGKKTVKVIRTTYLIEDGIIKKAFGNVKAADNPSQMLGEV